MMATHRQKAARKLQSISNVSYQQALRVIDEAISAGYPPTSGIHGINGVAHPPAGNSDAPAEDREWILLLEEMNVYRKELSTLMQIAAPTLEQLLRTDSIAFMICRISEHLSKGLWCEELDQRIFDKALDELVAGRFAGWPDDLLYGEAMARFSRFPYEPDPRERWRENEGPWAALVRAGYATHSDRWELTDAGMAQFFPDGPDRGPRADYLVYAFPNEYKLLNGEAVEIVRAVD